MKNKVENLEKNKLKTFQSVLEWFIRMILYAIILVSVSLLFPNTIYIDRAMFGLWALMTSILITILNQTVKPIIVWLTLPLTGITLGLFYPFVNLMVLKLASVITMGHFEIYGIFVAVLVSLLISVLNITIDKIFFTIIGKEK